MGISDFDKVLAWIGIAASSIGKSAGGVTFSVRSFASSITDPNAEDVPGAEVYGTIGFLSRPRDETATGGAEGLAVRVTDDLVAIAARDLRIATARGAMEKGTISVAGYTGAHLSILDETTATKGSVQLRQPTAANSNAPHLLALDGKIGDEKITITHALGHAVAMDKTGLISIVGKAGQVLLQVDDAGGVVATKPGGAPEKVALALAFVTYGVQVANCLGALKGAIGSAAAGIPIPQPPGMGTASSSVLKASP